MPGGERLGRRQYMKYAGMGGTIGIASTSGCLGGFLGGGSPVPIGAVLPESGSMSESASGVRTGIDFAVEDLNEAGAPLGRGVELHSIETSGEPDAVTSAVQNLINQQEISVFIGGLSNNTALALAGIVVEPEVYGITPSATTPLLSGEGFKGEIKYFGRTAANRGHIGIAMAEAASEQIDADGLVIVHPEDRHEQGVATKAEQASDGLPRLVTYASDTSDYSSEAEEIVGGDPGVIFLIGHPSNATQVVQAVANQGYSGPWIFSDLLKTESFAEGISGTVEQGFAVSPNPRESPGAEALANREAGQANELTPYAYDALVLSMIGMHQGGGPAGFEAALNTPDVSRPNEDTDRELIEVTPGVEGIEKALNAIDDRKLVNYQGASGYVDLSRSHDPLERVGVYQIDGSEFQHTFDIPADVFAQDVGPPPTG